MLSPCVLGIFACNWKYVADLLLLVLFSTLREIYRELMSTLNLLDITEKFRTVSIYETVTSILGLFHSVDVGDVCGHFRGTCCCHPERRN
jgi:hypothetical protein